MKLPVIGLLIKVVELFSKKSKNGEKTQRDSGISKTFFDTYFEGRKQGYALKITSPKLYDKPKNPIELIESFVAPQSFKYIEEEISCGELAFF